jgi:N-acetylglucosamine-6-phosphate deacetylase
MIERLRRARKLRSESPALQSAIAGWHIEGPFLSPEPGFHGAHDPAKMSDPSPERIRELKQAAENDPVLLTLAPERSGALESIAAAVALGMRISLGHTNASAEQLALAVKAGASGFTHLGNGCTQQLDRHDNILWRVFDTPGLTAGVIPDRIHVSPAFFRVIHRQLHPENIYYTTDAVSPAGAPPGEYCIGGLKVNVGPDQVVRQPGRTNFAGSALRPIDGVLRAVKMLEPLCPAGPHHVPADFDARRAPAAADGSTAILADSSAKFPASGAWQHVWRRFSVVPRRLAGLDKDFAVDKEATFCLLQCDEQLGLVGGQMYVRGELLEIQSAEFNK